MAAIVTSADASRRVGLTPADDVTLCRAVLVVVCGGLVLAGRGGGRSWSVPAVAGAAWVLDAVDGQVARRTSGASERGGRWDNATDAALVAVLALAAARTAPWGVVAGLLYPSLRLGQRLRPAWRQPLPSTRRGRLVGTSLTASLLAGSLPGVRPGVVRGATAVTVGLVVWSFAADVRRLERQAAPQGRALGSASA